MLVHDSSHAQGLGVRILALVCLGVDLDDLRGEECDSTTDVLMHMQLERMAGVVESGASPLLCLMQLLARDTEGEGGKVNLRFENGHQNRMPRFSSGRITKHCIKPAASRGRYLPQSPDTDLSEGRLRAVHKDRLLGCLRGSPSQHDSTLISSGTPTLEPITAEGKELRLLNSSLYCGLSPLSHVYSQEEASKDEVGLFADANCHSIAQWGHGEMHLLRGLSF